MSRIFNIAVCLILAGCASSASFRVVEYGTANVLGSQVGGCAVHRSKEGGKEKFRLYYQGTRCVVEAVGE